MPHADTLPSFDTGIAEVLSPTNPLGIKAGGEGGTTAAPAAVVSAILDALREFGVRDIADAGDALCGLDGDPASQGGQELAPSRLRGRSLTKRALSECTARPNEFRGKPA